MSDFIYLASQSPRRRELLAQIGTLALDVAERDGLELEVVGVRYRSDDGQFAVLDAVPSGEDAVPGGHEVVVGPVGHLDEGDVVRATGRRTQHPKHGERFQVRALLSVEPGDDEAVSRVLQRVPGVGPRAAEALIERFGEELLPRLEENPRDVLRRVKGLSGEKLAEAVEAWRAEAGPRAVRLLLERHGLDAATIGRVIRALGDEPDAVLACDAELGVVVAYGQILRANDGPGSEEAVAARQRRIERDAEGRIKELLERWRGGDPIGDIAADLGIQAAMCTTMIGRFATDVDRAARRAARRSRRPWCGP